MNKLVVLLVWCLTVPMAFAQLFPPERFPTTNALPWSAGVPGGIAQYGSTYTMFCNVKVSIPGSALVAVGDGTTDDTAALNAAITLCPNQQFVYLPAGTYRTTAELYRRAVYNYDNVLHDFSIIIRGEGPSLTHIKAEGSDMIIFLESHHSWGGAGRWDITNSVPAGATNIPLASASGVNVGDYALLSMPNDPALANIPSYMKCTIGQINLVTSKSGNTLGMERPIYAPLYSNAGSNYDNGTNAQFGMARSFPLRCGVEDLSVERMVASGDNNISFGRGIECWVKNVESIKVRNWHVAFYSSFRCEVRQCYLHDAWNAGGNAGYGVQLFQNCTDCLVEDNAAYHCRHAYVTEYGGMGNVFGYNFSKDPINENMLITDFLMIDACHHGGYPMFNLWEGNIVARMGPDNILGGSFYNTSFRNWVTLNGLPTIDVGDFYSIDRNNLSNTVVSCVLATPGQTRTGYEHTLATSRSLRSFGSAQDGDVDYANYDTRVLATTIWHGVYDYVFSTNVLQTGLLTNYPTSLYLVSKPSWYSNLVWPTIGSDLSPMTNMIPAQARYYGIDYSNPITPGVTNTYGASPARGLRRLAL